MRVSTLLTVQLNTFSELRRDQQTPMSAAYCFCQVSGRIAAQIGSAS